MVRVFRTLHRSIDVVATRRGNQLPVSACQVAALLTDMLCNFYLAKNHKIAENLTTTKARAKIRRYWESFEFFDVCLTKFKNNKISHRFLLTTKLFTG
jgi:hypothetical protein